VIFRRYAALGSVRLLKDELEAQAIKSKLWTTRSGRCIGGKPFSRGALYLICRSWSGHLSSSRKIGRGSGQRKSTSVS
jgi:hypothetical protein